MAAISHASASVTTQFTTTSATYVDVTAASIADTSLTAGNQYLVLCIAQLGGSGNGILRALQVVHGSTAFAQSEMDVRQGAEAFASFGWFTVWTAAASESLKVQAKADGVNTTRVDNLLLFAMDLDSLTENTDWAFNERTNDDGLSTTPTDGGSITITPAAGDWLVLTSAQYDMGDNSTQAVGVLDRSGEATSTTPSARLEATSTSDIWQMFMSRVFTVTAASNTFKEISSATSGTAHVRLNSAVFILNLEKFAANSFAFTAGDTSLNTTDFGDNIQTLSITPTVTGNVLAVGTWSFDCQNLSRTAKFRLQVDNADDPTGQTTDTYNYSCRDSADERPFAIGTLSSQSNSAKTYDLDASVSSTTSTPAAQDRSLWAFSMELAGGGGGTSVKDIIGFNGIIVFAR